MLLKLSIKNFLLIHDLEMEIEDGFSVITGETGAGKSILLGALSLILGQRADSGSLLDKTKKCIIEGLFSIRDYNLEEFFSSHDLDYEETIMLRREISQNGKSRNFINDTPVNLIHLKELGERLVNVHSQNAVITLNDSNFQLAVIDSYAGIQAEVANYRTLYGNFTGKKKQLADLEYQEAKVSGEKDYLEFLLQELILARLIPGELQEIEEQLELLSHAEEVKSNIYQALQVISGSDGNILALLTEAGRVLNDVSKYKPEVRSLTERIKVNYVDIKDISNDLNLIDEQVLIDPAKAASLAQRMDVIYRLLKKHQVQTVGELLDVKLKIERQLAGIEETGGQINVLRMELADLEKVLIDLASGISSARNQVVPEFEKEVTGILVRLGIAAARFNVDFLKSELLTKDGIDKVRFLFSANKGIELKDLSNSASGGEMSRLMLAIKSMISQKNLLPTIIFDEIDNGVSGEVAGKVGAILKRMGGFMQVLAITHLPQIAAQGQLHYRVYKSESDHTTSTFIKQLSPEERIVEIAKMLSNEKITDSAYKMANELLNN